MNTRTMLVALLGALTLHGVIAWQVFTSPINASGDAQSDGDAGTQVGLGQLGAYADASERLAQLNKPKPAPAPAPTPEPVPEPLPKPTPIPKEPVYKQAPKPEQPVEPVIEKVEVEKQPETLPPDATEERQKTLPEPKPDQAASSAMVKATGRSEQQASGGKRGNSKSYIRELYQWLSKHRTYPPAAKKSKQQGTVQLAFTMNRQGEVLSSAIKETSGHPLLDNAALRMLEDASPLPAVPDDFFPSRQQLPLVMPIEFSLITNSSFGE
jgi:protein TonB